MWWISSWLLVAAAFVLGWAVRARLTRGQGEAPAQHIPHRHAAAARRGRQHADWWCGAAVSRERLRASVAGTRSTGAAGCPPEFSTDCCTGHGAR